MKDSDKPNQGEGTQNLITQKEHEATTTAEWEGLRARVPMEVRTTLTCQVGPGSMEETQLLLEMHPRRGGEGGTPCSFPSFHPNSA